VVFVEVSREGGFDCAAGWFGLLGGHFGWKLENPSRVDRLDTGSLGSVVGGCANSVVVCNSGIDETGGIDDILLCLEINFESLEAPACNSITRSVCLDARTPILPADF
jgi:hypothetical protein